MLLKVAYRRLRSRINMTFFGHGRGVTNYRWDAVPSLRHDQTGYEGDNAGDQRNRACARCLRPCWGLPSKVKASRALEKQEDDGACRPWRAARLAKLFCLVVIFTCGFRGRVLLTYKNWKSI